MDEPRYRAPDPFTRRVLNPLVRGLARLGISLVGSRELRVRGRSTGEWRSTPVNVLSLDGRRHLVAPRGQTQWVRNIRAAGGGELRLGRRTEAITVVELTDDAKPPVLREYLRRWGFEVGQFFPGLKADSTDEALRAAAPDFPAFLIN